MENILVPTDQELKRLKKELEEKRKIEEYERLKQDIYEINIQSKNELTDLQGGLKQADSMQILKAKNRTQYLTDLMLNGFIKMMSPRPVARNMVAIFLIFLCSFLILNFLNIKQLEHAKIYFCYFIEIAAGIQILKSASRSLLIPIFTTIIGAVISAATPIGGFFLLHHQAFFQVLMVTGIVGIALSVFTID